MDNIFENVVRECIIRKLKDHKISKTNWINLDGIIIDFNQITYEKLLANYIEIKRKYFIVNKKLEIKRLNTFTQKMPLSTKNQKIIIKEIEDRFKLGKSIKPYLTSNLHFTKFSKEDFLLKNHNIYHLHLSSANKDEHLVKRSGKLIFFTYDKDNIYFIDLINHPIGKQWDILNENLLKQIKLSEVESINNKNVVKNLKMLFGDELIINKSLEVIKNEYEIILKDTKDDNNVNKLSKLNAIDEMKNKILELL